MSDSAVTIIVEELAADNSRVQCTLTIPKPSASSASTNTTNSNISSNKAITLNVSTTSLSTQLPEYGSLVYALPSKQLNSPVISTNLFTSKSSIDFTTRCATLLATKTKRPVYVNSNVQSSIDDSSAALTIAVFQFVNRSLQSVQ